MMHLPNYERRIEHGQENTIIERYVRSAFFHSGEEGLQAPFQGQG